MALRESQAGVVLKFDRHHLQRDPLLVIAEKDKSQADILGKISRRVLLEAQTAMFDDMAGAFTRYPVLGCGTSPPQIHACNLLILSDNISTNVVQPPCLAGILSETGRLKRKKLSAAQLSAACPPLSYNGGHAD